MSVLPSGVVNPSLTRYAVTFCPSTVTAKSTQPQPLEITKFSPRSQLLLYVWTWSLRRSVLVSARPNIMPLLE